MDGWGPQFCRLLIEAEYSNVLKYNQVYLRVLRCTQVYSTAAISSLRLGLVDAEGQDLLPLIAPPVSVRLGVSRVELLSQVWSMSSTHSNVQCGICNPHATPTREVTIWHKASVFQTLARMPYRKAHKLRLVLKLYQAAVGIATWERGGSECRWLEQNGTRTSVEPFSFWT